LHHSYCLVDLKSNATMFMIKPLRGSSHWPLLAPSVNIFDYNSVKSGGPTFIYEHFTTRIRQKVWCDRDMRHIGFHTFIVYMNRSMVLQPCGDEECQQNLSTWSCYLQIFSKWHETGRCGVTLKKILFKASHTPHVGT